MCLKGSFKFQYDIVIFHATQILSVDSPDCKTDCFLPSKVEIRKLQHVTETSERQITKFQCAPMCIMQPFALLAPLPVFFDFHTIHSDVRGVFPMCLLCMCIYGFYWQQNSVAVRDP